MLMSSLQFAAQIVMAKAVLSFGIVKRRKPAELTWRDYFVHGMSWSWIPLKLLGYIGFCSADLMSGQDYERSANVCFGDAVVPNGAATGLDIGLSNFSLSLITLSFYTMCKSTTPVFLLGFCFLWGIERCASPCHSPVAM